VEVKVRTCLAGPKLDQLNHHNKSWTREGERIFFPRLHERQELVECLSRTRFAPVLFPLLNRLVLHLSGPSMESPEAQRQS